MKEGTYNGKKIIVRKCVAPSQQVQKKYLYQIGIAIPYTDQTSEGYPIEHEQKRLDLIEDALVESLTQDGGALFVASITTNGVREFVFYTGTWSPEAFEKKVKAIESSMATHELQFMMKKDLEWSTYFAL